MLRGHSLHKGDFIQVGDSGAQPINGRYTVGVTFGKIEEIMLLRMPVEETTDGEAAAQDAGKQVHTKFIKILEMIADTNHYDVEARVSTFSRGRERRKFTFVPLENVTRRVVFFPDPIVPGKFILHHWLTNKTY